MRQALDGVEPSRLVRGCLRRRGRQLWIDDHPIDLGGVRRLHVLGAGKAAPFLFQGLRRVLGSRLHGGLIVSLAAHRFRDPKVVFLPGDHPYPGRRSLEAGRALLGYARREIGPDDLVFVLVSGGASAMAVLPLPGVTLEDKTGIARRLLESGADVRELNCLRKHMSALKGGRLAEALHPARHLTLVLSDIVGSPAEDVGSGPTLADSTSFAQCWEILRKYDLLDRIRPGLKRFFENGRRGRLPDTPKPGDLLLGGGRCRIVGDNRLMLQAAQQAAVRLGFQTRVLSDGDRGDVGAAAVAYAEVIRRAMARRRPGQPPLLFLAGGELTVTVRGRGKGGRNQEFMLHLLRLLDDAERPFFALSVGSDGIDGPTDAAGAWIDRRTGRKAARMGLDPGRFLRRNDSYRFFRALDQLIVTGPTRTNVMDLRLFALP